MKRFLIIMMLVLATSAFAATPNPGHDASRIGAGTFSSGNYTFPANLDIAGRLIVDTSTLYVDNANNRVGIGTTQPSVALVVNTTGVTDILLEYPSNLYGRLRFGGNGQILVGGSTYTGGAQGMGLNAAGNITLSPGNSALLHLDTTNRRVGVGTGTAAPGTNLHVRDGTGSGHMPTNVLGLFVENAGSNNAFYVFQTATSVGKSFSVTNAGNVGIGTILPTQRLDVNGSANITSVTYTPQLCLNGDCRTSWPSMNGSSSAAGWTNTSTLVSLSDTANNVSANALFVDNTNGRVGVGTTDPSDGKFVVHATSGVASQYINTDTNHNAFIGFGTDRDGTPRYGHVGFDYSENVIKMVHSAGFDDITTGIAVDSSGDVGIGTVAPEKELHVNSSGNAEVQFTNSAAGKSWHIGSATSDFAITETGVATHMTVQAGGNVGVGTANPQTMLHIVGGTPGSLQTEPAIGIDAAQGYAGGVFPAYNNSSTAFVNAYYMQGAPYVRYLDLAVMGSPDGSNGSSAIRFLTNNVTAATVPQERMRIDGNGNVGIGTNAPGGNLHVEGSTPDPSIIIKDAGQNANLTLTQGFNSYLTATNALYFGVSGTQANALTILANGKTGIGSPNPNQELEVSGSANVSTTLYVPEICLNGVCSSTWSGGVSAAGGWTNTSTVVSLSNSANNISANALFVDNTNGRVGVGTTQPTAKFQVNSDLRIAGSSPSLGILTDTTSGSEDGFVIYTAPGGSGLNFNHYVNGAGGTVEMFLNGTTGNLGLGTTAPTGKLEVISGNSAVTAFGPGDVFEIHNEGSDDSLRVNDASGDTTPFVIDNSGKVGVGVTAPTYLLDINRTDNGSGISNTLRAASSGRTIVEFSSPDEHVFLNLDSAHSNTYLPVISFKRLGTSYGEVGLARASTSAGDGMYFNESEMTVGTITTVPFSIKTNGVRRLFVETNGNVGIGTGAPQFALDINGSYAGGVIRTRLTNAAANGYTEVQVRSNNGSTFSMGIEGNETNTGYFGSSTGDAYMVTTVPTTIGTSNANALALGTNNTERVYIAANGSIGIGTTSPTQRLHLVSADASTTRIRIANSAVTTGFDVQVGVDGTAYLVQRENLSLDFYTNNAFAVRMAPNGTVGINTTTPGSTLHVVGSANITGTLSVGTFNPNSLTVGSGNSSFDTDVLYVDATNNRVGVGKTNPGTKLHVTSATGDVSEPGGITIEGTGTGARTWQITPTESDTLMIATPGFRIAAFSPIDGKFYAGGLGGASGAGAMFTVNTTGVTIGTSYYGSQPPMNGAIIQGSLGVGTTVPGEKLEVVGNILLNKSANATNVIMTPTGQDLYFQFGNAFHPEYGLLGINFTVKGGGYTQLNYGGAGTYQYSPYGEYFHMGYSGIILSNDGGFSGTEPISLISSPGTSITGNVAIGSALRNWHASYQGATLQLGTGASVFGHTASVSAAHTAANYYINTSGSDVYMGSAAASDIYQDSGTVLFRVASSGTANSSITWRNALYIDNNGGVGIGTTTPQSRFQVGNVALTNPNSVYQQHLFGVANIMSRDGAADTYVVNNAYYNSSGTWISPLAGTSTALTFNDAANVSFRVLASNSSTAGSNVTWIESLRVNNAGSVSIGGVNPDAKLEIAGDAHALRLSESKTDNTRKHAYITQTHYDIDEEPIMMMTVDSQSSTSDMFIGGGLTSTTNAVKNILFYTGATPTTLTGSEAMRINGTGYVGIGTTNPVAKLHVLSTSEQFRLAYDSDTLVPFTVDSLGLLTIGDGLSGSATFNQFKMQGRVIHTDKPLLELAPAIRPTSIITDAYGFRVTPTVIDQIVGSEATNYWGLYVTNPTGGGQITNAYGAYIEGRVGIGTATPGEMLSVSGNINASGTINAGAGIDLAEAFSATEPMQPGDIVAMVDRDRVRKASGAEGYLAVGIVTTQPGMTLSKPGLENPVFIAIAGRVPVKVEGAVQQGDYIAVSGTPGVGKAAAEAGYVLGRALEDSSNGVVYMLIQPTYFSPQVDQNDDLVGGKKGRKFTTALAAGAKPTANDGITKEGNDVVIMLGGGVR